MTVPHPKLRLGDAEVVLVASEWQDEVIDAEKAFLAAHHSPLLILRNEGTEEGC